MFLGEPVPSKTREKLRKSPSFEKFLGDPVPSKLQEIAENSKF
jgi:hypothetical protein